MLEFKRRLPANVPNPEIGFDTLFLDNNGVYYTKDSTGNLTVLGNGIQSVAKINTTGLVDTYRITFDSNETFDYTVTNARSIVDIIPPATPGQPGATDTYQIDFNDGPNDTFIVYNGTNGLDGQGQPAQNNPTSIDPDDAASIGTRTAFYALEDHQHAIVAASAVGLNGGSSNGEGTAASFARSDHTHAIANGGTPSTIQPDATAAQGTSTSLARADHTHAIATDVPVSLGAAASEGTSTSFARADHVHLNPVIAHEAAADPHPQYTTTAEAAAAAPVQSFNGRTGSITPQQADYDAFFTTPAEAAAAAPVQSVNGQTGNVTINVPLPLNANRVGLFTSTANSTAVQPFLTLTIPANRIVAGATYSFFVAGTQSQSAAATNVVFTVQVNGTTVATATVAGGTAAQTNRGLTAEGMLQFTAAGAGGQVMGGIQAVVTGIAANGQTNVAGVAVNTTANVTITLTAQTSTANAANIIRVAAASISERA